MMMEDSENDNVERPIPEILFQEELLRNSQE